MFQNYKSEQLIATTILENSITNKILVKTMKNAIKDIVDDNVITLIENTDRALVLELIQCKEYIDSV